MKVVSFLECADERGGCADIGVALPGVTPAKAKVVNVSLDQALYNGAHLIKASAIFLDDLARHILGGGARHADLDIGIKLAEGVNQRLDLRACGVKHQGALAPGASFKHLCRLGDWSRAISATVAARTPPGKKQTASAIRTAADLHAPRPILMANAALEPARATRP